MRFEPTALAGVWVVRPEPHVDERGSFARWFDAPVFAGRGLVDRFDVVASSVNPTAGTLRGLHWQEDPHGETKLVRCARGRVWDVVVDVRPGSPTRHQHVAVALDARDGTALYVPPGFAHGFLTLFPDSEVEYHLAGPWVPAAARGMRWDDPTLAIPWPAKPASIAEKDASWPLV